jgi:hypothetical protein
MSLLINETLLALANHKPSVVDDANLFCTQYSQVKSLHQEDILLLGASRMQTGIDLAVIHQRFPERRALMLAQSGLGTAYPVFLDIVENTTFNGTVILDETEQTLVSQNYDQEPSIDHCQKFSLDRRLNRHISTALQSHLMFLNPQSSSLRLWGNLLVERKLPEPFYTRTLPDRQQFVDYERAEPTALQALAQSRLTGIKTATNSTSPEEWLAQTRHWQPLVQAFQKRGGTVIFVQLPVSQERWAFEKQLMPPEAYWKRFAASLDVQSLRFADFKELSSFSLPDTSHLDQKDKTAFTQAFLNNLPLPSTSFVHD